MKISILIYIIYNIHVPDCLIENCVEADWKNSETSHFAEFDSLFSKIH